MPLNDPFLKEAFAHDAHDRLRGRRTGHGGTTIRTGQHRQRGRRSRATSDINVQRDPRFGVGARRRRRLALIVLGLMFSLFESQAAAKDPRVSPLAPPATCRGQPAPSAAGAAPADSTNEPKALQRASWRSGCRATAGWTQKTGVVHMPIDEAKKQFLQRAAGSRRPTVDDHGHALAGPRRIAPAGAQLPCAGDGGGRRPRPARLTPAHGQSRHARPLQGGWRALSMFMRRLIRRTRGCRHGLVCSGLRAGAGRRTRAQARATPPRPSRAAQRSASTSGWASRCRSTCVRRRDRQAVRLGDYLGKRPVLLALVYYECPMLCTQVLNGLTGASRR